MRRQVKASFAGSHAVAVSSRRLLKTLLAALALAVALFAVIAAPASAAPPTTNIGSVSNVLGGSAHVTGEVNAGGFAFYSFQYSTDDVNWTNANQEFSESTTSTPVSFDITGLKGSTKYFVRLTATNFGDPEAISPGPDPEFTTLAVAPPVILATDNASNVSYTTVTVSGEVERPSPGNPDTAFDVNCNFEYITAAAFAPRTEKQSLAIRATGGTFTLSFADPASAPAQTTATIARGASAATVQAALEALSDIGAGGVAVSGGPANYTITFAGPLAGRNVAQISVDGSALTGPEVSAETTVVTEGHAEGFEGATPVACTPNPVTAADPPAVEANLTGLANNTTYHLRIAASNAGGTVTKAAAATFTTLLVTPPIVTAENASAVTGTTAHFSGHVTAGNADPAFESVCAFDYVTQAQFEIDAFAGAQSIGCTPGAATGTGSTAVIADPTQLIPHTVYHLRLRAQNQNAAGPVTSDAPATFQTESIAPQIGASAAHEITTTSATLTAQINPGGAATTYHFEFLTEAEYQAAGELFTGAHSTPESAPFAADNGSHGAIAVIEGLSPDTVYRFRVIATNAKSPVGGNIGPARSFRTVAGAAADSCPNAAVRAQQGSIYLPDCRAFELVSPIAKYSSEAGAPHGAPHFAVASADGSKIFYGVFGPIEPAERGIQGFALGSRGPQGWTSANGLSEGLPIGRPISALKHQENGILLSKDLSSVAFDALDSRLPNVPESANGSASLYLKHPDGSLEWLSEPKIPNSTPAPGDNLSTSALQPIGGSPDLSTVYFLGRPNLLAADQPRIESQLGGWGVYEYTNGVLKPAGTLPDGSESPGGSGAANTSSSPEHNGFDFASPDKSANQVSGDGSTLIFLSPDPYGNAPGPVELYVRSGGHSTLVSHAANGTQAPSGISALSTDQRGGSRYGFLTEGGNMVFFRSSDVLATGAPEDSSVKTYRYDVATNTVTYLPGVGVPLASSDDGQVFLFATSGGGGGVWDHGTIRSLGTTAGAQVAGLGGKVSRSTASGSVFVFSSVASIDGAHNAPNIEQVYRYDLAQGKTTCLSCTPDDVTPTGSASLANDQEEGEITLNRGMSEDGSEVFFDSPDPLVPADVNGKRDVYEWNSGRLSLISSGRGKENAFFLDNSANGSDVFFATADGMVPADRDGVDDVYDARVGGGSLEPVFNPCSGEACRSAASEKPAPTTAGTSVFNGDGNRRGKSGSSPGPKVKVGAKKVSGGNLSLTVTVPGAGKLSVSGKGLKSTQQSYSKGGKQKLKVPLSAGAKSALKSGKSLKLKVHLRFKPKSGKPSSVNFVITVKA